MMTLRDLQDSPYRWERAMARKILRREEQDPWVWCERFRHKRRLSNVNSGKPCRWCREDGLLEDQRAGE